MRTDHTRRELLTYGLGAAGLTAASIAGFNWWNQESHTRAAAEAAHSATAQAQASASSQAAATMQASADAHASWKAQRFSGGSKAPEGEYRAADNQGPAQNVPVPVAPEGVSLQTPEGAYAFLDYWAETRNYAVQTGDITLFSRHTLKSYKDGETFAHDLYDVYLGEGWIVGGRCKISYMKETFTPLEDNHYFILGKLVFEKTTRIDHANNTIDEYEPTSNMNYYHRISLKFGMTGMWSVENVETYAQ